MRRGGYLRPPTLRFRRGTAATPYEGLKMGFLPYRGPNKIRTALLVGKEVEQEAKEMYQNLVEGVGGYEGFQPLFDAEISPDPQAVVVEKPEQFVDAVEEVEEDVDLVMAYIPDEMAFPYYEDPYMPLKQALAQKGLPSQMINYSTCKNLATSPYVLFNLALNTYTKAGGTPWILDHDLSVDAVVGYDVSPQGITVAIATKWRNLFFKWIPTIETAEPEQTMGRSLATAVVEAHKALNHPIQTIEIHREGTYRDPEIEIIRKLFKELADAGYVEKEVKWLAIEVKRRFTPRILKIGKYTAQNPDKGTYLQLDHVKCLVCTTGYPERRLTELHAPTRPIMIEVADANWWDYRLEDIARDIYWLSELHWASAFVSTKTPITTLYPNRICSFWKAGVQPTKKMMDKLWFL